MNGWVVLGLVWLALVVLVLAVVARWSWQGRAAAERDRRRAGEEETRRAARLARGGSSTRD